MPIRYYSSNFPSNLDNQRHKEIPLNTLLNVRP